MKILFDFCEIGSKVHSKSESTIIVNSFIIHLYILFLSYIRVLAKKSPVFSFVRFLNVKSSETPNPNVRKYETFPEMVILPEGYGKSLVRNYAYILRDRK